MIRKRTVTQTLPAALSTLAVLRAAIVVLAMALFAGCDTPYSSPNWPYGSGGGGATPLLMDTTPPGVITHLAALTGSGTVAFTWLDPADDDLDYIEIWAGTSALSGTVVGSISRGKQTFMGTGTVGTDLFYHFIAVDKAGNRSAAVNYMVKLVVIEADVTNLVGMITGANSVKLSWTDPVSSLFYQADITDNYSGSAVAPKGTEQSAWNSLSNTTYTFTVKAVDGGSSGGRQVSMSLTQDATPPGAVSGLGAIDGGFGSVELNWTNPGDTDLQYVEITCDPLSGPAQMVNVSAGSSGTYTWTGLAGGVTYTFTVTAVDHSGNKSPGVSVSGTPLDTTPPGPVTSLGRLFGDERVVLTWTDPGDADLDYIQIDYGMAAQQTGKGNGTYTWNNLTNGTAYTFTVKAIDLAGNRSAPVTIGPVSPRPRSTEDDDDFGLDPLFKDVFTHVRILKDL
ncbi:MAG: fibronectin type III domain-containing protein [Treponema sp.]|nr:fibronectin type III domain-containing protein [Treponema sp.]